MIEEENCCGDQEEPIKIESIELTESEFYANKETNSQARLNICKECDKLVGPVNICKMCGCFMNIKVRIYSATCPLEKW